MNGQYENNLKLPLMKRINKKEGYKNLFKDKKPTKRKYIYPKDDLEYENDNNESNVKQKKNWCLKKK